MNFRFLEGDGIDQRYIISQGGNEINLSRLEQNNWTEIGGHTRLELDEWHLVEVSYFDDTLAFYVDGKEKATWTDPNPWEGGYLT